ncbi:MAG: nucleoside monophosphate kinase [Candidatus Liptonbacteria bacterium]|nr:nucleoside monophosphate kinase [Candidatus Liptonbacteria bacterium]
MKKVVILYGPPGSGKGTQANLLAAKLDVVHFDTGKFLEALVHNPDKQKDATIARERKLFDSGILMTPGFVLAKVKEQAKHIYDADYGVVFSGSPRTMYEAKGLLPFLIKLYGKKNINVFVLAVGADVSTKRNSNRMMCKFCGYGLLSAYYDVKNPKHCPVCGGPFYRRTLDNPKTIIVRLKEYAERTEPVLKFMKAKGVKITKLDARPAPYKVFEKIVKVLKV